MISPHSLRPNVSPQAFALHSSRMNLARRTTVNTSIRSLMVGKTVPRVVEEEVGLNQDVAPVVLPRMESTWSAHSISRAVVTEARTASSCAPANLVLRPPPI